MSMRLRPGWRSCVSARCLSQTERCISERTCCHCSWLSLLVGQHALVFGCNAVWRKCAAGSSRRTALSQRGREPGAGRLRVGRCQVNGWIFRSHPHGPLSDALRTRDRPVAATDGPIPK
eukprot:1211085-Prymnesium_polylepis.1